MEITLGPELGGRSRGRQRDRRRRRELQGAGPRRSTCSSRKCLLALPAPAVRALPQPGLRRLLPLRRALQARRGRHRARGPGALPGLALLRLRLPVQEDLLQLEDRPGGEVPLLLPPHGGRPADALRPQLRGPHPLHRGPALRRRPHPRGGGRRRCRGRLPGAPRHHARPARPQGRRRGRAPGHPRKLPRGGAALAGLPADQGVAPRAAAAPGVPHPAHGLVRAAAQPGEPGGGRGRSAGRHRLAADPGPVSGQPAHGGRRGTGARWR